MIRKNVYRFNTIEDALINTTNLLVIISELTVNSIPPINVVPHWTKHSKMIERNKESVETYNKSASNYQDKFMKMDLYNDTFDTFWELIERENSEILEIASVQET